MPNPSNNEWTITTLYEHYRALRVADDKFQAERDRRYAEVATERALAMKIKETADLAALDLARESQKYKEQQGDVLRDKNLSQTGIYATHSDVAAVAEKMSQSINLVAERMEEALKPLVSYVSTQQGTTRGSEITTGKLYGAIAAVAAIVVIMATIFRLF